MPVRYPPMWSLCYPFGLTVFRRQQRSFRHDAQSCINRLRPPLQVLGSENIPASGPCLVTVNHYSRPGFRAWWIALGISACLPFEVHWLVTAAWTYPDPLRSRTITPVTRWFLQRLAAAYDFTTMPPMPPDPAETHARAEAVLRVLRYARSHPCPAIGLAPEGMDSPDGRLGSPPPGSGRLMAFLAEQGLPILPVGAFESQELFCLRFGPPYRLELPRRLDSVSLDRASSDQVMRRIAELLPPELHPFEKPEENR